MTLNQPSLHAVLPGPVGANCAFIRNFAALRLQYNYFRPCVRVRVRIPGPAHAHAHAAKPAPGTLVDMQALICYFKSSPSPDVLFLISSHCLILFLLCHYTSECARHCEDA